MDGTGAHVNDRRCIVHSMTRTIMRQPRTSLTRRWTSIGCLRGVRIGCEHCGSEIEHGPHQEDHEHHGDGTSAIRGGHRPPTHGVRSRNRGMLPRPNRRRTSASPAPSRWEGAPSEAGMRVCPPIVGSVRCDPSDRRSIDEQSSTGDLRSTSDPPSFDRGP